MAKYADIKEYIEQTESVSLQDGVTPLRKFGRGLCAAKQTKTTLMTQLSTNVDTETLTTANLVDTISSSAANTRVIGVQGYTVDTSGDLTYVSQDVTLTGTTGATLTTPLSRVTRMFVKDGTFGSPATDTTMNIYASESTNTALTSGVPSSAAFCKCILPAFVNQTEKAQTCSASNEYIAVLSIDVALPEAASPTGTAAADVDLEIKRKGGTFRPVGTELSVGASFRTGSLTLDPPVVVPPNSDFRLVASASTSDLKVSGAINGVIFKTQGT